MKKLIAAGLSLLLVFLTACGGDSGSSALAPFSSSDYQGRPLEDVTAELKDAGFTAVEEETMLTYSEDKVGTVGTVTINGDHLFKKLDKYSADAPVVVSYYAMQEQTEPDPVEPADTSAARDAAWAVDQQFSSIRTAMEGEYNAFVSTVHASSDDLAVYDTAKTLNASLNDYLLQLMDVDTDTELATFDDYRLFLYQYASDMIEVTKAAMAYLDSASTADLSAFKAAADQVSTDCTAAAIYQDNFLYENGYTYDEIDALLGN